MASTSDLQELLRVLTTKNVKMMTAMGQIKSLQAVGLRSVQEVAEATASVVSKAIGDDKAGRSVHAACKKHHEIMLSGGTNKRPSADATDVPVGKRLKSGAALSRTSPGEVRSPAEAEQSLALPVVTDENRLTSTRFYTNRAPVLLAFTLELLRATMPEQPMSSRLSLAQAVVSINAKAKAIDLGLESSAAVGTEAWGDGQPKIKIMGREISVLKRGGYPLNDSAEVEFGGPSIDQGLPASEPGSKHVKTVDGNEDDCEESDLTDLGRDRKLNTYRWSTSSRIDSRGSSFIAHAIAFTGGQPTKAVVTSLLDSKPSLKTASHNFWGYRVQRSGYIGTAGVSEGSNDDGETGGGDFIVRLLKEAGSVDRLVVVTRWFGGVMLGPDRWRLIRNCVNEALAEGLREN
ncbi:hypothetical protein ACHAQA_009620, partial [Verticillium albo-atrum]